MQLLPLTTSQDVVGPVYTLPVGTDCTIRFVTPSHFARCVPDFDRQLQGERFAVAARSESGHHTVLVANAARPHVSRIDRDDSWHRRLELATLLPTVLNGALSESRMLLRRQVPVSLLVPIYLEALPPGTAAGGVRETLCTNTQQRFDVLVAAIHDGKLQYDVEAYSRSGVEHSGYSHLAHFAWIYAQQVTLIEDLLRTYARRKLTIVDIGTGCGHFLLTLARHFVATGQVQRVRLVGIDDDHDGMSFARREFAQLAVDVEFVTADVAGVNFADALRRHRPDVVIANHVLEHLPGEVKNRYLHDWLLAARLALSVSVPLGDDPDTSISEHVAAYTVADVVELATNMELRVGHAARAGDVAQSKFGGLCSWIRTPEVADWGGFSCTSVSISPSPIECPRDSILEDFASPFDPSEFARVRRAPKIGEVQDRRRFSEIGQPRQVRQLPIKMPGSDVRIPGELAKFSEAIQIIVDHNHAANPDYATSFAYLNFFQGTTLFSSYRGLSLSCHGDQLQSLRSEHAYRPDWSYIVSNTLPTILYEQAFDVSEAVGRARAGEPINLYDDLNAQAAEANVYRSDNFGIYLLSPYVVHSAALAESDSERVFMKVAFSTKRFFDNRELRRNPAFDIEDWYLYDTVGYIDGWLSHAHWNERYVRVDVVERTAVGSR